MKFTCLDAVLVAAFGLVIACLILQTPRGDEPLIYEAVIKASIKAFPSLNTTEVAYGVSPLWTWTTGLIGASGCSPVIAGRIVSLLGWLGCGLLLGGRRLVLASSLCWLHPLLLVFAARCHPFWLGMACLLAAARVPNVLLRHLLGAAAASIQPFLIPAVVAVGLLPRARSALVRLIAGATMGLVAVLGMLSNWVLYGGQYPAAFKQTGHLAAYLTFDGFNEVYFALVAAGAGLMLWLIDRPRPSVQSLIVSLSAVAAIALGTGFTGGISKGPVASIAHHCGTAGQLWVWTLAMAAGGMGLSRLQLRRDWPLALCLMLAAIALSRLPFTYERYMWFSVVAIVAVIPMPTVSTPSKPQLALLIAALTAAGIFCVQGSL
jgi:branched-subunit amino acid transport protein